MKMICTGDMRIQLFFKSSFEFNLIFHLFLSANLGKVYSY